MGYQTLSKECRTSSLPYYADGTQLDVALCSNDSTAPGVTQAIESDYAGKNDVLITGQDGDKANLAKHRRWKTVHDSLQSSLPNEAVVTLDLAKANAER